MGLQAKADVIDVVDRGYDLSATHQEWVAGIAEAHRHAMGLPDGCTALTFRVDRDQGTVDFELESLALVDLDPVRLDTLGQSVIRIQQFPDVVRRFYGDLGVGSVSQRMVEWGFSDEVAAGYLDAVGQFGYDDFVPLTATNLDGRGLHVVTPSRERTALDAGTRRRWEAVAAHLAAGLRLRDTLGGRSPLNGADAVLETDGRFADAAGDAVAPDARDRLRQAARRLDASRCRRGRADPDAALAAWTALVDGRWTILDHFDTDGRRYLVARHNEPVATTPKELSQRERQVVGLAAQGHANKLIGYELGLSEGTVKAHLRRGLARLAVGSRAELAALWADLRTAGCLEEMPVGDDTIVVASRDTPTPPACLTETEGRLLSLVRQGRSDREIARIRGVSPRTVGNQLGSIYRKLGVVSRSELLAREADTVPSVDVAEPGF